MIQFNPNYNWQSLVGNALTDAGAGIARYGFGNGFAAASKGMAMQADARQQRQQEALEKNQTSEWIKANFPQYANLPAGEAWQAALGELQAKREASMRAPTDPLDTYEGRLNIGQQQGLSGGALTEFSLTGKLPDAAKPASLPTSYQEYLLSQQDPNYAKTLNSTTSKPPTEGVIRNRQLLAVVEPEARTLLGDGQQPGLFEKLADGGDQARDMGGDAARLLGQGPSAEYQTAKNALRTIIQNYLYSVSGATATPQEVENQANILTPKLGESEQSVNDKKRRIAQMVEAIKGAANPQGSTMDIGGYTVLSVE